MIKLMICDDQDLVCVGLKAILSTDAELEVVATAHDGSEALELMQLNAVDVALMDLKMLGMNGVQATHAIHQRYPQVQVLVLTTYGADNWVFDAIRAGACGYLLKDTPRQRLIAAIKEASAGKTPVNPAVAGKLFAHVAGQTRLPESNLTDLLNPREVEVLSLLGRGLSNAEIAARIYLSEGTVRNYVSSIFEKLSVSDRTQAAILAIRSGLMDFGEK